MVRLKYLVDSNIVSEPLKPAPAAGILDRLKLNESGIALPSPAWHELRFGCSRLPRSRKRKAIETYLDAVAASFPILGYEKAAAEWHALERARLTSLGRTPPYIDGQVAAIAFVNNLVLVTSNRKDFEAFRGLKVEDWR